MTKLIVDGREIDTLLDSALSRARRAAMSKKVMGGFFFDLREEIQRFLRDLEEAFTRRGRRFDPNGPHLLTRLIVIGLIVMAVSLLGQALLHLWPMVGRP